MDTVGQAKAIIQRAEAELRSLMESGVREQRYAEVGEIAGLAAGLAELLRSRGAGALIALGQQVVEGRDSPRAPLPRPAAVKAGKGKKGDKSTYPRFEREGDKLVKIGWSKSNKSPYEHRASKDAVLTFVRHLQNVVTEGRLFVIEDLLPVLDPSAGAELPAYQVYLTLAWLRSVGAIEKKGRDGYVMRRGALANGSLERMWSGLPDRG